MKQLFILIFLFFLLACSNNKTVYWCGDHACINKKEREAYFKKTMIVEIKEVGKKNDKDESNLEIVKKQTGIDDLNNTKDEKKLAKQERLKEKRQIKEEKRLSKEARVKARVEEKRRIKEEKRLAKEARLREKGKIKEEKELAKEIRVEEKKIIEKNKKILKTENVSLKVETVKFDSPPSEFEELVKKIIKRNTPKSYPNINDIPN